ncbi:DUF1127 domain-containing protein [Pontibacterium sp.]|uniref:DUF1127 domain-containing protein n=1 Tax=Pontibacterium sp. TaxID=2036026 RepID=UPI003515D5D4
MTIIALFVSFYRKLNIALKQRQTYYELRDLSPAQLKDIGLRIENGVVLPEDDLVDTKKELQVRLSQREKQK